MRLPLFEFLIKIPSCGRELFLAMFEQCCVRYFVQIIGKTRVTITLSRSMSDFDDVQIVHHVI